MVIDRNWKQENKKVTRPEVEMSERIAPAIVQKILKIRFQIGEFTEVQGYHLITKL